MEYWKNKIERTNYHSPVKGTLIIDVGINVDGSIYSMKIIKSSGSSVLDKAAKKLYC